MPELEIEFLMMNKMYVTLRMCRHIQTFLFKGDQFKALHKMTCTLQISNTVLDILCFAVFFRFLYFQDHFHFEAVFIFPTIFFFQVVFKPYKGLSSGREDSHPTLPYREVGGMGGHQGGWRGSNILEKNMLALRKK